MPRCCRFFVAARREEDAYPSRSGGITDEQRWRGEKMAQPGGRARFGLSDSVARSSSRHCGTDMLVARALPSSPNRARVARLNFSTDS